MNYIYRLEGKPLDLVAAEAKAVGMSYGQYRAAVSSGMIERVLREKRIFDGPERIKAIDDRYILRKHRRR
ncbi:MAG: hypothetical protein EOM54_10355 [Clostridia bacterium]|nr:hypothetical protein [Clostridia bacterium]